MQRKEIQRGDLFYYDFGKREGSVQSGERPVMVIQADNFNANAPTIIVATIEFMITLQPYAAFFTFVFLAIKSLMLIKWR